MTLRSTKIRIKSLWPVKLTLEIIKRGLLVFCWSCDEIPLKWEKKHVRASSLWIGIEWDYSWVLTPLRNDRSMPLNTIYLNFFWVYWLILNPTVTLVRAMDNCLHSHFVSHWVINTAQHTYNFIIYHKKIFLSTGIPSKDLVNFFLV